MKTAQKLIPALAIASLILLLPACSYKTFSGQEKEIITRGNGGIMRLWRVDNEPDSLLLRKTSKELTHGQIKSEEFKLLKAGMLATVTDPADSGVGIAAPQVGISRRLIAVQRFDKEGEPFEFYINPKITWYSPVKKSGSEGCLSIPDFSTVAERSQEIEISHTDEETGNIVTEKIGGFTAIIFQHEIDHLDGILFSDRIPEVE